MLFQLTVVVVHVENKKSRITFIKFPLQKDLFEKCCYIIYDGWHYESLHLSTENNSDEEIAVFSYNDEIVKGLLLNFLQERFHIKANINLK